MNASFQTSDYQGYKLCSAEVSALNSVAIGVYIPVGSRHEEHFPNGISHFVEHMIFKGTINRSASQIAHEIEGAGCTMNAYTTEDHTLLEMRGHKEHTELMFSIMTEMLWSSTFEETEIENERSVIEEEIIGYEESPSEHIHDLLSKALWPNNSIGKPITGSCDSIQSIDKKILEHFVDQFYFQQGITIASAGNIQHTQLCYLSEKYLPMLKSPECKTAKLTLDKPEHHFLYSDIEQAHLAIGFRCMSRHHKDRHALGILNLIMGETMSSRLFQRLREELGLCYSIHSDYTLFEDIGSIQITAAFDADSIQQAKLEIGNIIGEIKDKGISETELLHAQNYACNQSLLALEGSQPYMNWIGDSVLCYGEIIPPEVAMKRIRSVKCEDVQRVAQKYLTIENTASALIAAKQV